MQAPDERFQEADARLRHKGVVLHSYQVQGVKWMMRLEQASSGGVLADDPGLGKTLQTLSLVVSSPLGTTTLIIVPKSILGQWETAAKKLVGKKRVYVYWGPNRDRSRFKKAKAVITTYDIARTDLHLSRLRWFRIVLDEAHIIKNRSTKTAKVIMGFTSQLRWGLTGTPVHNNKGDLENLFRFVKGLPSDSRAPIGLEQTTQTHLLRRIKEVVLKGKIPNVTITSEVVDFNTDEEKKFYQKVERNVKAEFKQLADQCLTASQENVIKFELLLRLRQAAQHPQLVLSGFSRKYKRPMDKWEGVSCKHAALIDFIKSHPSEGSLVFCQFTEEMDILEKLLYENGLASNRLDGSVSASDREDMLRESSKPMADLSMLSKNGPCFPPAAIRLIAEFTRPKVFLIQIRAGGVGLNLQAYSRVYLTSPDWNPCNEIQAIARSHRLGQRVPVIVKKLVLRNGEESTIDDRICKIQMVKRNIMADILNEDALRCNGTRKTGSATGLSTSEMRKLIG
jgi:SNF2 family DNA or RNA helicase